MNVKDRWCHRSTVTSTEGSQVQINSWWAFRRTTLDTKEFTLGWSFTGNTASPPSLKALHRDLFGNWVKFFFLSTIQSTQSTQGMFYKKGGLENNTASNESSFNDSSFIWTQKQYLTVRRLKIKMYAISVLLVLSPFLLHVNEKHRDDSDHIREACQPLQTQKGKMHTSFWMVLILILLRLLYRYYNLLLYIIVELLWEW